MSFEIPDACTLMTAERPVRLTEFDDLFANAVGAVELVNATWVRMHLAGPAGLESTVRDLTARETECCSYFTFTVSREPGVDGEALVLDVRVPVQYADVLTSLAERASTVAAGQTR